MGRQMFLFSDADADAVTDDVASSEVRVLTWNIQNPSIERARAQLDWLVGMKANIIILTEAKYSKGSDYIVSSLESLGYTVFFSAPVDGEYSTIIASRGFVTEKWAVNIAFLPHRVEAAILKTFLGDLRVVGMYAPSHGMDESGDTKRLNFQCQITQWLASLSKSGGIVNLIVGGDLNVIEPDHVPHIAAFSEEDYQFYDSFTKAGLVDAFKLMQPAGREYSWISRDGEGQRLDHFFVSTDISSHIIECCYKHASRRSKLSDHSAMWLSFS